MKKSLAAIALSLVAVVSFAKTTLDDIKRMPEDKFKAFIAPLPAANAKRIAVALHGEAFGTPKKFVSFEEMEKMTPDEFKAFINSATLEQARIFAACLFSLHKSEQEVIEKMANHATTSYDLRTLQVKMLVLDASIFFKASGIKPEDVFKDKALDTYNEFQRGEPSDRVSSIRKMRTKK